MIPYQLLNSYLIPSPASRKKPIAVCSQTGIDYTKGALKNNLYKLTSPNPVGRAIMLGYARCKDSRTDSTQVPRRAHGTRRAPEGAALAREWKDALWDGRVEQVLAGLQTQRLGPPQESDGAEHPRRVLANNVGYFQTHRTQMDYPRFRRNGWPIGSGVTKSGVKQFNKRVKGAEQFWCLSGVEAILALRELWLSQDERWERYWNNRPGYEKAA
jgi:hypothetical protein